MKLKNGAYYSRKDFIRHVSTIALGRFAFDGSPVTFIEVAAYLNVTADSLRMRKKDAKVMQMLKDVGIQVKKIKGMNYFFIETEDNY